MSTTRTFEIHRDTDISGISGTGIVADGAVFLDGTTVVRWREVTGENYDRGVRATTVVFPNIEAVEALHGHNGATRLVFADSPGGSVGEDVSCVCGAPEAYSLRADERINHRTDGPCTIEQVPSNPHLHFNANGAYINPPLNTVTEDPA